MISTREKVAKSIQVDRYCIDIKLVGVCIKQQPRRMCILHSFSSWRDTGTRRLVKNEESGNEPNSLKYVRKQSAIKPFG
jgi:hypothetical protein